MLPIPQVNNPVDTSQFLQKLDLCIISLERALLDILDINPLERKHGIVLVHDFVHAAATASPNAVEQRVRNTVYAEIVSSLLGDGSFIGDAVLLDTLILILNIPSKTIL